MVVFSAYSAHAQQFFLLRHDSTWRQSESLFSLDGLAFAASSGVNTGFMKTWLFGGELTRESLSEISDGLSSNSRFGAEGSGSVQVMDFTKPVAGRDHWGLKIRLDQRSLAQGTFTRDAFNLVFLGNKDYLGKKAVLSPTGFDITTWQKLGIGVFNKNHFSNLTLSFVSGQRLAMFNARKASLSVSPFGTEIQLNMEGEYLRSDTAVSGFGAGNGVGFALDADRFFPLRNRKGYIGISIQDVGMVHWNSGTLYQESRADLAFSGFDLNDVLDKEPVRFEIEDSIFNSAQIGTRWTWLPARTNLIYTLRSQSDYYYELGIEVRPTLHFVPRAYAAFGKFFGEKVLAKVSADVAGYGLWSAGLAVEAHLGKHWYLAGTCANVPGLFLDKMHSIHSAVSLRKFFGKSKWKDSN